MAEDVSEFQKEGVEIAISIESNNQNRREELSDLMVNGENRLTTVR